MVLPPVRRNARPKTPPRRVFGIGGGVRKMGGSRMSIRPLANSNQVDMLERVRKLLDKNPNGESEGGQGENPRDSRLKVVVRVRPLNSRETTANARNIINVASPNMLVFDPKVEEQEFFFHNRKQIDVTAKKYKNQKFAFDHVYGQDTNTGTIFTDVMQPLLSTLLSGFNCSVFAYGTTGSGKTFTMLGNPNSPGLTFLTMNELFQRLDDLEEQFETKIAISYFEVYNEQVRDLLNPTGEQLQVREVGNGIDIANLTFRQPSDVHELLEMLQKGNNHRSQHPTDHNAESSRSHAILQVHVHMRERYSTMNTNSKTAKLVMVDLAGSEKCAATGSTGQRFREGANINKSLLALSNCISALASGRKYCSYRDSKLTRILKDSLGGNCKTVMITNISPSHTLYDDTLNTLRYAEKAKKISCNAKKNVMTVQTCLTQYTKVVDEMTTKIENFEAQAAEKDALIQKLLQEKADRDAEIMGLKGQVKQLEGEVQYYRFKKSKEDEDAQPTWLPNPTNIPNLHKIVNTLNDHISTKQKIRPVIEGFITEFQLKAKRYEKLNSLAEATADHRYKKAAQCLQNKLQKMISEIDSVLQKIGTEGFSPCVLNHRTVWESVVSAANPTVQISSLQLYNSYVNQFKSTDLTTENAFFRSQIQKLLKECIDKESLLEDAALLCNQMKNVLEHYEKATPSLLRQYNDFVAQHSGNPSVVRFADFVDSKSPPILPAEVDNAGQVINAQVLFEKCELEDYFNDILQRLKSTSKTVKGAIFQKLNDVLAKVDIPGSKLSSEADCSFNESLNSPEANSSYVLDDGIFESIEEFKTGTVPVSAIQSPPNQDFARPALPDSFQSRCNTLSTFPRSEYGYDINTKQSECMDLGNTTVTLTKKLEETFTKDEESIENTCPRAFSHGESFNLPTITEIVKEKTTTSSHLPGNIGATSSGGEGGSRPVFLSIQLPEGDRPEHPPHSPSSAVKDGIAKVIPSGGTVRGMLRVSPRLKSKNKGAVNYSNNGGGRGGGGFKSRPYPMSRGGKSQVPK